MEGKDQKTETREKIEVILIVAAEFLENEKGKKAELCVSILTRKV